MFIFKKVCKILRRQSNRSNGYENEMAYSQTTAIPAHDQEVDNNEDGSLNLPFIVEANIANCQIGQMLQVDRMEDTETADDLAHVYVDAKLLEQVLRATRTDPGSDDSGFCYEINGSVFPDGDANANDLYTAVDLLEFEVKEVQSVENELDGAAGGIEVAETDHWEKPSDTESSSFPIAVQSTPYGLIVNRSVLVSASGWNALVGGRCLPCDSVVREAAQHAATDQHRARLARHAPLQRFHMNIVREINGKYHCAICNVTFEDTEHLESQAHGDNVLASTNRASDITQTDANDWAIGGGEKSHRRYDCIQYHPHEDSGGVDGFYDDVSLDYCPEEEDNLNSDIVTDSADNVNTDQNPTAFSYADIAKKSKVFTTAEYVHMKLGDRCARVTFDSWHMVITLRNNSFYCMACRVDGPLRFKSDHCLNLAHVENLMKCSIVKDYKEHVIRKVDNKLYHCGHCNNLQVIHEIKQHINSVHTKKNVATNMNLTETDIVAKCTSARSATASPKAVNNKKLCSSEVAGPVVADNGDNNRVASTPNNTETTNNSVGSASAVIKHSGNTNDDNSNSPVVRSAAASPILANDGANGTHRAAATFAKSSLDIATDAERGRNTNKEMNAPGAHSFNTMWPALPNSQPFNVAYTPIPDTIIIRQFGHTYRVSLLAYHLIQWRVSYYFCWLCESPALDLRDHIVNPIHTARVTSQHSAFLPHTGIHLIRQTNYGFHCTVCNVLMHVDPILHTWDTMHLTSLGRALYPTPSPPTVSNSHLGAPVVYSNRAVTPAPTQDITETCKNKPNKNKEKVEIVKEIVGNRDTEATKYNDNIANDKTEVVENEATESNNKVNEDDIVENKVTKYNDNIANDKTVVVENEATESNNKVNEDVIVENKVTKYNDNIANDKTEVVENEATESNNKVNEDVIVENKVTKYNDNIANDKTVVVENEATEIIARDFDLEEYVYVKIKNVCSKITVASYHGLVPTGSGTRLCVLCSAELAQALAAHVCSQRHLDNLEKYKFLHKYERHLLRQISAWYHCALCNVSFTKRFLHEHLSWSPHKESETSKIAKHIRRKEIKSGIKEVACSTQKQIGVDNMESQDKTAKLIRTNEIEAGPKEVASSTQNQIIVDNIEGEDTETAKHSYRNDMESGAEFTSSTQKQIVVDTTKSEDNKTLKLIHYNGILSCATDTASPTRNQIDTDKMEGGFEILSNLEFRPLAAQEQVAVKKNKIIMCDGVAVKVSWDAYHGVCRRRGAHRCLPCRCDLRPYEVSLHAESARHASALQHPFLMQYWPALIREVSDTSAHCLNCNCEVSNESHALGAHVASKRHAERHAATVDYDHERDDHGNNDVLVLDRDAGKESKKKVS